MWFPSELIDLIVSEGLDSCITSISWSCISPHYKDLITKQLGLVILHDGVRDSDGAMPFLDYSVLMDKGNTLHFETDHPNYKTLKEFIVNFSSLLVIIHSGRSYNDVLASILNDLAQSCLPGTSLCIVYSNSLNFLSKLYFRELSLYRDKIRLCELHVLGNGKDSVDEVCDLNTLFERTYLYNLRSIYSLDVQSSFHELISTDLHTIKQLNYVSYDEASSSFLSHCPNLRVIESMKFPIKDEDTPYRLPRCETLTLTHYVSGCHYPPIDGSAVAGQLTLVPSLRSEDPQFHDLYFPALETLRFKLNDVASHQIRLQNCNFSSLKSIVCGSCMIPWDDLLSAGWKAGEVVVTLTTEEQLRWLTSPLADLDKLTIVNPVTKFVDFPASTLFETSKLNCSTLSLELSLVWQCYLLQKLILPNLTSGDSLMITLDEEFLSESLSSIFGTFKQRNLVYEDDCVCFRVPALTQFKIFEIGSSRATAPKPARLLSQSPTDTNSVPMSTKLNVNNAFFDVDATNEMCYAVSPSEFRRNSLAGLTNESARRQSAIVFPSGNRARRASSISSGSLSQAPPISNDDPFERDTVVFEFTERLPKVLTTNLAALESSLFSWRNLELNNRIPLLQVEVQTNGFNDGVCDVESLTTRLAPRILEVLKFPYDVRLPNIVVERFQGIINIADCDLAVNAEQQSKLATDLQTYLACRGQKVPVLANDSDTGLRVSLILRFR